MGTVIREKESIFSTEIGIIASKVQVIRDYNPEDYIKRKAMAQGRVLQYLNIGKDVSINSPTGVRTITTAYFKNDIVLPED